MFLLFVSLGTISFLLQCKHQSIGLQKENTYKKTSIRNGGCENNFCARVLRVRHRFVEFDRIVFIVDCLKKPITYGEDEHYRARRRTDLCRHFHQTECSTFHCITCRRRCHGNTILKMVIDNLNVLQGSRHSSFGESSEVFNTSGVYVFRPETLNT